MQAEFSSLIEKGGDGLTGYLCSRQSDSREPIITPLGPPFHVFFQNLSGCAPPPKWTPRAVLLCTPS